MDGAYVSAEKLAEAKAAGRELIGPAQPAPKKEGKFSVEDFQISVEERKAFVRRAKKTPNAAAWKPKTPARSIKHSLRMF